MRFVEILLKRPFCTTLFVWGLFGALHGGVRLAGSDVLSHADGLEVIAVQQLNVGYWVGQPPLFDWLLWLAEQIFPVGLISVFVVKYGLMLATGLFIYGGVVRAVDDQRLAILGSLSLLLLFNVSANMHEQSTHSVALVAAIAMTFYGMMGIVRYGRWLDYVVFGVAGALGILSKHGYPVVLSSFVCAVLLSPDLRARIFSLKFVGAVVLMLVVAGPYLLWLLERADTLAVVSSSHMAHVDKGSHAARALSGEVRLVVSLCAYLLPFLPVAYFAFPELLRLRPAFSRPLVRDARDVLTWSIVVGIVLAVIGIGVGGIENIRTRYVHVLALLIPAALVMRLDARALSAHSVALFVGAAIVFQVGHLAVRAATFAYAGKPFCSSCTLLAPFRALAGDMVRAGLGNARIYVFDNQLGGNLRVAMPDASVRLDYPPVGTFAQADAKSACIVVWEAPKYAYLAKRFRQQFVRVAEYSHPWPHTGFAPARTTRWKIGWLSASDAVCSSSDRDG